MEIILTIKSIFPFSLLFQNKTITMLSMVFSPVILYIAGYLFLWGYYFGGMRDFSILTMMINYVPLNKSIVILIGFFYLLVIIIIVLAINSLVKEKISAETLFVPFSLLIANLALVIFFFGDSTWLLFIEMLKLFILPLAIIIVTVYFYIIKNFPYSAFKFALYFFVLYLNLIVLSRIMGLDEIELLLSSQSYMLFLYFGLPVTLLFNKIKSKNVTTVLKFLVYISCLIPLVPMLVYQKVFSVFVSIVIGLFICILFVFLLEKLIPRVIIKMKRPKINKTVKPLYRSKPTLFILYVVVVLFICLITLPSLLIRGGDYFQSIVGHNEYHKISYIWNGEERTVEGVLVSNINNKYYISTNKQQLYIIQADKVQIQTNQEH